MRKTELKRKTPLRKQPYRRNAKDRAVSSIRQSQPRRDWGRARAKVEAEGCCRLAHADDPCEGPLEAAHTIGREHDEPHPFRKGWLYVSPDRVAPLCRRHHGLYDDHERDLLGRLLRDEEVRAVGDVGLENARVRLAPSCYRKDTRNAA